MNLKRVVATVTFIGCLGGTVLAQDAGDPAAGEKVFARCRPCHMVGEGAKNSVGPVLNGVVGRKAGTYPGYPYSEANRNSGLTWDEATLKDYLHAPQQKVKGTKMVFAGIKNDHEIDDLIAFLKQYDADGKKK